MAHEVECWTVKDPQGRLHPFYTSCIRKDAVEKLVWNLHDEPWESLKKKGWKAVKVTMKEVA